MGSVGAGYPQTAVPGIGGVIDPHRMPADPDAAFRAEAASRVGLLPGVVLTVRNATAVVLSPVEAVVDGRN